MRGFGFPGMMRRGPGRGKGRLLIALVIAGIAIFTYFSRMETNPTTGERQSIALTVDQEKALGLQAAPEMARQMGGVLDPNRNADARRVAELGRKLVATSDAARSPYADNFNFYLLADARTINAFALPGGQIFITKGLYDRLEDEAQLAGVLGHEIGHVIARHSAEQMSKGQLGQSIAIAIGVGADDGSGRGQSAAVAAQAANQMLQLRYGREDELQSDSIGLKYMVQAGYDPSAMLGVMKVLAEASRGNRQPEFLGTHPHPESRVAEIEKYLAQNYPGGVPPSLTRGEELGGGARLGSDRD